MVIRKRGSFSWFTSSVKQKSISSSLLSGWEVKTLVLGYISVAVQSWNVEIHPT